MKPARIILLIVALVAGGLAAFLVTRGGRPAPQQQVVTTEVVEEAKTQVLVAKSAIGIGQRLDAETLEWQNWPETAVRPEYVTIATMPEAPQELTGAVVRFEFFPGEPIREAKLVRADQGYLSAVLSEGMRGVSVGVSAVSSAGGFVIPNDHVDVVLTTQTATGQQSEVLLSNVRVLAIGKRLGELGATGGQEDPEATGTTPVTFDSSTIATLELNPRQAETLINAATLGQLSLTLRSVVDFNKGPTIAGAPDTDQTAPTSQTVRLIRFGRDESIQAGAGATMGTPVVGQVPPVAPNLYTDPNSFSTPQPDPSVDPQVTLQ